MIQSNLQIFDTRQASQSDCCFKVETMMRLYFPVEYWLHWLLQPFCCYQLRRLALCAFIIVIMESIRSCVIVVVIAIRSLEPPPIACQGNEEYPIQSTSTTDSFVQTDCPTELVETGTMTTAVGMPAMATFDGMATVSTEGQETNPAFLVRPQNIRVLEGEPIVVRMHGYRFKS